MGRAFEVIIMKGETEAGKGNGVSVVRPNVFHPRVGHWG
jgi:hypothetical protein